MSPSSGSCVYVLIKLRGIPLLSKNESVQPWNGAIQHAPTVHRDVLRAAASCGGPVATNPGTFWYEDITHNGISPFINDGASWPVFRNVKTTYGAAGDGVTDDADAIQNAILGKNAQYSTNLITHFYSWNRWDHPRPEQTGNYWPASCRVPAKRCLHHLQTNSALCWHSSYG